MKYVIGIQFLSVILGLHYHEIFLHSHRMRKYWFYVKHEFRNFQLIFTF